MPWIFIGRTDAEAPILWPPDEKSQLVRKDPDAETVWGQEEKGMTEDEMVGWYHRLDGREFEWALGAGDAGHAREAWSAAVFGSNSKSRTQLSNWTTKSYTPGLQPHDVSMKSYILTPFPWGLGLNIWILAGGTQIQTVASMSVRYHEHVLKPCSSFIRTGMWVVICLKYS